MNTSSQTQINEHLSWETHPYDRLNTIPPSHRHRHPFPRSPSGAKAQPMSPAPQIAEPMQMSLVRRAVASGRFRSLGPWPIPPLLYQSLALPFSWPRNNGRGSRSARKPLGKAKMDSKTPRTRPKPPRPPAPMSECEVCSARSTRNSAVEW